MIELKLYKSKWKAIRLILLGLPFVIAFLYFIIKDTHPNHKPMEWFGLCFFGLSIPLGLFNLLDRRPQIIINEMGIYDRIEYKDFINWNLIKDAYYKEYIIPGRYGWPNQKQKYVCLTFDSNDIALLNINKTTQKLAKILGHESIFIFLNPLQKINGQKLGELVNAMVHGDAKARQDLLLTSEL
jgi:hypothetical protein